MVNQAIWYGFGSRHCTSIYICNRSALLSIRLYFALCTTTKYSTAQYHPSSVQECSIVHPSVLFVLLPVCECATRRNHTSVFPPFSHRRYPALVRSNWHLCRTIIESSLWWWAAKICEFRRNPTLFMDPLLPPKTPVFWQKRMIDFRAKS